MNPHDFFAQAWDALEGTLPASQVVELGTLRIRWAAPDESWLELLGAALNHSSPSEASGEVEIRLFSQSELELLPPLPVEVAEVKERGRLDDWCTPEFLAVAPMSSIHLADRRRGQALVYYCGQEDIPLWDRCAPFRLVLGFLAPARGHQLLHAAATALGGQGVLLVGRGGSGKSSSALVSLGPDSRWTFLSEDYTLLDQATLTVRPLYRSFKVDPTVLERMPWLRRGEMLGVVDGKECRLLPPELELPPTRCRVLVWPDRQQREPTLELSAIAALKKLAPSTLFQNPNARAEDFKAMASLCRQLPCRTLGLGDSPAPSLVEERLKETLS